MLREHVHERGDGGEDLGHGREQLEEQDAPDGEGEMKGYWGVGEPGVIGRSWYIKRVSPRGRKRT